MKGCLSAHGIEGLNRLNDILRPYLDLRSFYFGARSVVYRMCKPKGEADTTYLQLREIDVNRSGDILSINYTPIRRKDIARITYSADIRSPLLEPLKSPRKGGDEAIRGFFDKKSYCPAIFMFNDLIAGFAAPEESFQPIELKCEKGGTGVLDREIKREKDRSTHAYKLVCKNAQGSGGAGETIYFVITPSRRK